MESSWTPPPEAMHLPSLQLTRTTNNPAYADVVRYSTIAVGPSGQLLFTSPREAQTITVLSPDGRSTSFGARGDGPGEIRDPQVYQLTDSTATILDRANSRLSRWSLDGGVLDEQRINLPPLSPVVTPIADDRWLVSTTANTGIRLTILHRDGGRLEDIDVSADSFVRLRWSDPRQVGENPPALGVWPNGFILADTRTYSLGFFDWRATRLAVVEQDSGENHLGPEAADRLVAELALTGRRLSPAARSRLVSQARPWFSRTIRHDRFGRTWLVGEIGNSAYADVYALTERLGRLMIPCTAIGPRWDLNGDWLAVICEPDDPDAVDDAVVKLFRIVEPGTPP